jgi:hypothetical protein
VTLASTALQDLLLVLLAKLVLSVTKKAMVSAINASSAQETPTVILLLRQNAKTAKAPQHPSLVPQPAAALASIESTWQLWANVFVFQASSPLMEATLLMTVSQTARESFTQLALQMSSVISRVSAVLRTIAPRNVTVVKAQLTKTSVFANVTILFQPPKFVILNARAPLCKHHSHQKAKCVFTTPLPRLKLSHHYQTLLEQLSARMQIRLSASWLASECLQMVLSRVTTICQLVSLQATQKSKRLMTAMWLLVAPTDTQPSPQNKTQISQLEIPLLLTREVVDCKISAKMHNSLTTPWCVLLLAQQCSLVILMRQSTQFTRRTPS